MHSQDSKLNIFKLLSALPLINLSENNFKHKTELKCSSIVRWHLPVLKFQTFIKYSIFNNQHGKFWNYFPISFHTFILLSDEPLMISPVFSKYSKHQM
jgi:hypothetical protein